VKLSPSDSQLRLARELGALFEAECAPARVRAAEPQGFDAELWKAAVAVFERSAGIRELVPLALAAEACGSALAPIPFAEACAAERLLGRCAARDAAPRAVAISASVTTLALRRPLAGLASLVPAGAIASAVIALDGDALVLARSEAPIAAPRTLPCLPLADRRVDARDRSPLARGAAARTLFESGLADWQALTAAALVGLAARALELAVSHACEREQFGVPIGSFQSIQHRLADCATAIEGARLLARRAAWAIDAGSRDARAWASAAFSFASDTARATTAAAVQFHGGAGYTVERDIQLYHRRARGWPLVLGDAAEEWQRLGALLYAEPGGHAVDARGAEPGAAQRETGIDFGEDERCRALRGEVRAFLAEHLTPELLARTHATGTIHDWGFYRALAARGWIGASWPVAEGGQGRSAWEMRALSEELARADAPTDALATTLMVAGTLREIGSEWQKREILPRVLRGEITLCLGYSEPGAGSDLAAVSTRARRDGGDWIIDGEKSYTSLAHEASHVFLLARANPEAPKHRGLTMFLVPTSSAGFEIEAVRTFGAPGRTNRTFYRGVRVPDRLRVGEVDGGWSVVNVALTIERGGMFGALRSLEAAESWARAKGRIDEPELRARLARVWVRNEVASLLGQAIAAATEEGRDPSIPSVMSKLFASESVQRSTDELMELLGADALLPETEAGSPGGGAIEFEWRKSAVGTIYAGTSEVMRTLIAERHLGLPRGRPR
jgi:alkylation response protein AidB-like acyl-CoA dehydrogenase